MAIFVGYYPPGPDFETPPQGEHVSVYRAAGRGEWFHEFVTHTDRRKNPAGGECYDEGDVVPLEHNSEHRVYQTSGHSWVPGRSYMETLRREGVLPWVGVFMAAFHFHCVGCDGELRAAQGHLVRLIG